MHPDCASSLDQEWELALPEEEYSRLCAEPVMGKRLLVASSFTKRSLLENGSRPEDIRVVPYGVDLEKFQPSELQPDGTDDCNCFSLGE